ncbi:MAG: hypothetical protein R3E04_03935 [Sphingobium sp.]
MTGAIGEERMLGGRLIAAILLCPLLFTWLAFRSGYSWKARGLAVLLFFPGMILFSLWMAGLASLLGFESEVPKKDVVVSAPAPTPASIVEPKPSQAAPPEPAFVRDLPLGDIVVKKEAPTKLSPAARKMKRLYAELQSFRYEPNFHVLGYLPGTDYANWKGKVRLLEARSGPALAKELGMVPGDLLTLANAYQRQSGYSSERTDYWERKFVGLFAPQVKAAGQGRVTRDALACADIITWARSLRAMDEQKFAESMALQDQAKCRDLARGSVVSAPTARKEVRFTNGGTAIFIAVTSRNSRLWISEEEVGY